MPRLTSGPAYFLATSTSLITWLSRNKFGSTQCTAASAWWASRCGTEMGMMVCRLGYFSRAVSWYLRRFDDSDGGEDAPDTRMQDRPEAARAACRLMEQRGQYHPPGGRLGVYTISKAKVRRSGRSNISRHPRRIYDPTSPPSSVHPRTIARGTSSRRTWRVVAMRGGGGRGCISGIYPPLILRPGRLGGGFDVFCAALR